MGDGLISVAELTSDKLETAGLSEDAAKTRKFSDDWLGILGITSLVKDFVLNYLFRSAYHDKNGPLINAIRLAGNSYPGGPSQPSEKDLDIFEENLLTVCNRGRNLFQEGGSLHQMLGEFEVILLSVPPKHYSEAVTQ